MLFKLSLKNIQRSIKDYAIYFFTLILGIAVFYVFNALGDSASVLQMNQAQISVIDLLNTALGAISIFVSVVLGFLIIYASQFLIKRRKKEFGIYMVLGMGKNTISKILLMENFLIGLLSLGVGLLVGVGASQLMSILVANMFEVDMSTFTFTFSVDAMLKTILFFAIIYLFVMLFNAISISRCKLIDLINASKQNETVKLKKTWISVVLFVASIVILSKAYAIVTSADTSISFETIRLAILLGCLGTFLFFYSLSGFVLKLAQYNKRFYLKNLNVFVVRQIHSKINTTAISMSVISIMLFLTICILSSGLSIRNSMTNTLQSVTPSDITITKYVKGIDAGYSLEEIKESENTKITSIFKETSLNVDKDFKEQVEITSYNDLQFTMRKAMGDHADTLANFDETNFMGVPENIISLSDYNNVAKLYGNETYSLKEDEYIIIADYDVMIEHRNAALALNTKITINGAEYHPKYKECKMGLVEISSTQSNMGIFIVPDKAIEGLPMHTKIFNAKYNASDDEGLNRIEKKIVDLPNENSLFAQKVREGGYNVSTKITLYESSVGLGAAVTFIGLYLGIIFLITSAAVLALKELSESSDNKNRYSVLRKIGVSERMINIALFKQIAIFFFLPVTLAVVHSCFGIKFAQLILSAFGKQDMLQSVFLTGVFILFIYGGYFIITYYCSKNIIKEN